MCLGTLPAHAPHPQPPETRHRISHMPNEELAVISQEVIAGSRIQDGSTSDLQQVRRSGCGKTVSGKYLLFISQLLHYL